MKNHAVNVHSSGGGHMRIVVYSRQLSCLFTPEYYCVPVSENNPEIE